MLELGWDLEYELTIFKIKGKITIWPCFSGKHTEQ